MTHSKPEQAGPHTSASDDYIADACADSAPISTLCSDAHAPCAPPDGACGLNDSIARVSAVDRGQYLVRNTTGEVPAELTGRFFHASASSADLPCVGDWVCVRYHDAGSHASIHRLLPRKSFLRRKRPGDKVEFQMIAANIDVAFIVQSCHFDFNLRRLERYLVMTREGHIEPVILLTKTDLISPEALEKLLWLITSAGTNARVITLSNVTGQGIDTVRELVSPGKTYCLLGSSGVGKTTLVNCLVGNAELETGRVSNSGEGRHTTTRRQLIALESGGLLIDMPGMRELGMLSVSEGIDDSFAAIQALSVKCRFTDCTHSKEPGCAVQRAILQGELDAAHFEHYKKLRKEAAFHDLSQFEKRRKDRSFGKLVNSVLKAKGQRNRE